MKHSRTSPAVSKRWQIYTLNSIQQNQHFKALSEWVINSERITFLTHKIFLKKFQKCLFIVIS